MPVQGSERALFCHASFLAEWLDGNPAFLRLWQQSLFVIEFPYAILLGLIQGLTEFIPISSTAHLRIVSALLALPDPGAAYSAVIQLGTLLSLLVYFRRDFHKMAAGLSAELKSWRSLSSFASAPALKPLWHLVIATIPICLAGLLLSAWIRGPFRSLEVISSSLIIVALLMWFSDRHSHQRLELEQMHWKSALAIGLFQSLALIPGVSRSGITLTIGLLLGFNRSSALRFSFFLSLPAIALSAIYELIVDFDQLRQVGLDALLLGTAIAALSGYLAIAFLLRYLQKHSLFIFVCYRIALGVLILAVRYLPGYCFDSAHFLTPSSLPYLSCPIFPIPSSLLHLSYPIFLLYFLGKKGQ